MEEAGECKAPVSYGTQRHSLTAGQAEKSCRSVRPERNQREIRARNEPKIMARAGSEGEQG